MNDLKDFVIAAHGGLDRRNRLSQVRAHLLVGGQLWPLKKQDGIISDTMVRAELHGRVRTAMTSPTMGFVPVSRRIALRSRRRVGLGRRANQPEGRVPRSCQDTPWDSLHLASFAGYATWNYMTTPFSFAKPEYLSEELEPWSEQARSGAGSR